MRATAVIGMAPDIDPDSYDHSELGRYGIGNGTYVCGTWKWTDDCVLPCISIVVYLHILLLCQYTYLLTDFILVTSTINNCILRLYLLHHSPLPWTVLQALLSRPCQESVSTAVSLCSWRSDAQRVPKVLTPWPPWSRLLLLRRLWHSSWAE
jgi:hypothetical protein